MSAEWLMFALLTGGALWPVLWKTRSWGARLAVICLAAFTIFGGFVWKTRAHHKVSTQARLIHATPSDSREGFARSETCRSCHPEHYASWHRSFHRTMTQRATPEAVHGNFNDVDLKWNNDTLHLFRSGDEYWVRVGDSTNRATRITMTTGSHHMQAYWIAGPVGNHQYSFPFTWLIDEGRWVPRNDVFLFPPATPFRPQTWNGNCIGCHTTAGQPGQDAATAVFTSRTAELGIACEACHGPAEEHVRVNSDPRRRYAVHRAGHDATIINPARLDARKSSEICSQCHAARFSPAMTNWYAEGTEYWKRKDLESHRPLIPGEKLRELNPAASAEDAAHAEALSGYFWRDGQVRVSGREYNGLVHSPCYERGQLSCLSCHSMHKMTSTDDQLAPRMQRNDACYQCHREFEAKLVQHTHHSANSSGSLCYNCHMPHTTYGLMKGIRSHQIISPTVKSSIDTGRPNACNLCHLDQTLAWSARHLNAWFRQPMPAVTGDFVDMPASVVWLLRGDAGQRALTAWHMGWEPARQTSGTNWMAPLLAEALDDPYAVVRHIAERSLRRVPGFATMDYDYVQTPDHRAAMTRKIVQRCSTDISARAERKTISPQQVSALRSQRDDRPMNLLE